MALFLLDTTMNALMLAVALRLGGMRIRPVRLLGGAVFGAVAALCARWLGLGQGAALWLPVASGMMGIAAGRRALRRPIYHALLLFCAGGLLGGVLLAIAGASGSLFPAYLAAAVLALWVAFRALARRRIKRMYMDCGGVRFCAVIDSGNTLRDYVSGRPVIVLPERNPRAEIALAGLPKRLIFADTAGGRQMMRMAVPESVTLNVNGSRRIVLAAAALAPALDARSPALVPQTLIDDEDGI